MRPLRTWLPGLPQLALPVMLLVVLLSLYSLLRLALLIYTGIELAPLRDWPAIMAAGLWFDAVVASVLIAPVVLYESALPNRWRNTPWHNTLRIIWLFFSISVLLFGAVSEFTFWIEFSNRLNFIALDYLIYTSEVIRNVIESYPVLPILATIGVLAAVLTRTIHRRLKTIPLKPLAARQRLSMAVFAVAVPLTLLWTSSVDQMELFHNAYADELAGNGLFTLAAAARRNELDYLKFYRTLPSASIEKTLDTLGVVRAHPSDIRNIRFRGDVPASTTPYFTRTPKNLILISVESLSASFLGSYGSDKNLTPNLDAIARDGLRFEQVYATGTRTVRGLEALSLGTPPVPGQAVVRRPHNDHLATLGEVLEHQGFETFFFYGGYGYFDNMNAYFGANDYRVIDRTDIPSDQVVFENVWGVADEVLFNTVINQLDRQNGKGKPFFAHVMTTSNHRPYTYPNGRIDIPSPGGRDGAIKYTDYAIGKFILDAEAKPWFKDTLFVFVADHCASVAGTTKLPVKNYRIPLILYAPGTVIPGAYSPLISQIDIVPSLVEAMGQRGDNLFFGRSIFEKGPPLERAFISNYQELGYLRNNKLTVLMPKRRVQAFDIDPVTQDARPAPVDEQLLQEAIAYYQSASTDFHAGRLIAPFYQAGTSTTTAH